MRIKVVWPSLAGSFGRIRLVVDVNGSGVGVATQMSSFAWRVVPGLSVGVPLVVILTRRCSVSFPTIFTALSPPSTGFYLVLPSFTGFYWVLPSFTGLLLGLTGLCLVLV